MAVFTELRAPDADRLLAAHGLGRSTRIVPIPAGSVNSNFFVESGDQRWFARIYEEQDDDGVAYEWALLEHLAAAGVAVSRRVPGTAPGEVRIAGRPTGLFEIVGGIESCQAGVTPARARAVGVALAKAHRASASFPLRRAGRFTLDDVERRLDQGEAAGRPELAAGIARLRAALAEVRAGTPAGLPTGVIHGDLFRDNVRWDGDRIVAILDWESASDGALAYDLMVAVLAWCFGDSLSWELASAMVSGYASVRPLEPLERGALRIVGMAAATRFSATRITDYYLRSGGIGERVIKDWRRFLARLETLASMPSEEVASHLVAVG